MIWLDQKYVGLISSRLERFVRKDSNRFNFRCPVCGDSQKSQTKARGWIFESKEGRLVFYCHNCNASMGIDKFIKFIDPLLHSEYVIEKLKSNRETSSIIHDDKISFEKKMKPPRFIKYTELYNLKKISQLSHNHFVKKYVVQRKRRIPNFYHSRLFYAENFKQFTNSILPDKFKNIQKDEPRIVIPFINKQNNLIGFQGRLLKKAQDNNPKYITIMLNEDSPKIFNLDRINRLNPHIILEGPFDSMFVDNSMAMAGSTIDESYVNDQSIFVFDNEPRSKMTCKKISNCIKKGYNISLFNEQYKEKDINDMVVMGHDPEKITQFLYNNAVSGLRAYAQFNSWKKI
jgi:hypothetical protein